MNTAVMTGLLISLYNLCDLYSTCNPTKIMIFYFFIFSLIFIYLFLAASVLSCGTRDLSLWHTGSSLWCTGFSLVVACTLQST